MENLPEGRPRSAPKRLGNVIDGLLSRMGLASTLAGWRIVNAWPDIVGEKVAAVTKPIRYEDNTLLVSVPDAGWRQELHLQIDMILEKIHEIPGGKVVKKIRFTA
jgi:predicted nucleic acid-binding Zn ribbon protein